ncbi:GspH/FimT family pseudopilin [Marinobacter sp. OP 3.4]|uniref:GspH/FimT family pseudopilin n=1 Tax=Marinobacter sp. OP 3.4 TaxID=3076501 RepID=UPI002E1D7A61
MELETNQVGLTLVELVVAMAVMTILLTIAIPSASHLLEGTRTDSARNDLISLMGFARSSAIEHKTLVSLCSLTPEGACELPWGDSLAVFIDRDGDGVRDEQDRVLRVLQFEPANWAHNYRTASRSYFQWNTIGVSNGAPGSVSFCHPDIRENRFAVIVSFAGRIRASRDYNKDGVPERSPGTPVICDARYQQPVTVEPPLVADLTPAPVSVRVPHLSFV